MQRYLPDECDESSYGKERDDQILCPNWRCSGPMVLLNLTTYLPPSIIVRTSFINPHSKTINPPTQRITTMKSTSIPILAARDEFVSAIQKPSLRSAFDDVTYQDTLNLIVTRKTIIHSGQQILVAVHVNISVLMTIQSHRILYQCKQFQLNNVILSTLRMNRSKYGSLTC